MKKRIRPRKTNPVHCACCIQLGKQIPATWQVNNNLYGCNKHADDLDTLGLAALQPKH